DRIPLRGRGGICGTGRQGVPRRGPDHPLHHQRRLATSELGEPMATKKEALQATAAELGISFTDKTTIKELEALIAQREAQPKLVEPETPQPGRDYADANYLCRTCRKPADHVHRGV